MIDTSLFRINFPARDGSHWGGCEYAHHLCAIHALCDEVERLRKALTGTEGEIQQVLGKALGYPWYKDDPANFPGSTDQDGVCVGEHVAVTLAMEAGREIDRLRAELAAVKSRVHDACLRPADENNQHPETGDSLVDRLRGVYTIPVDDGAGPLSGSMTFTRRFPTLPINLEAADEIERLRGAVK